MRKLIIILIAYFIVVDSHGAQSWQPGQVTKETALNFYQELRRPLNVKRALFQDTIKTLLNSGYQMDTHFLTREAFPADAVYVSKLEKLAEPRIYLLKIYFLKPADGSVIEMRTRFFGVEHENSVDPHPVILNVELNDLNPVVPVPGMSGGTQ